MKAKLTTNLCYECGQKVIKDVVALNKKMLGRYSRHVLCLTCLSRYLGYPEEELLNLIELFKEQGCTLFTGEEAYDS